MADVASYMTHEHRECDDLFAAAEDAVAAGDWAVAGQKFGEFDRLTRIHLQREEEVLFPAFEERTGTTEGPTAVMRVEHQQMRGLLEAMAGAVAERDEDGFLGDGETLMILTQQHNMKEERVLYPMADQVLGAGNEDVVDRMRSVE